LDEEIRRRRFFAAVVDDLVARFTFVFMLPSALTITSRVSRLGPPEKPLLFNWTCAGRFGAASFASLVDEPSAPSLVLVSGRYNLRMS